MGLTKHPEGSLRELWALSFPLMISAFSVMAMIFVDRLLLARYSTEAFNSAVNATTFGWAFIFFAMSLGNITEVFVAQYNGAGQFKKLGQPVWQMLWLSLFSILFFFPLSWWGGELFYGLSTEHEMKRNYFGWMMLFGPSYAMYASLCGFFIGQGKTKLITCLAIFANLLNALLDLILIFGVEGWIAPMGITGAAIATSIGSLFQTVILGYFFLKKKNREMFGTSDYTFDASIFRKCLRIGLPNAFFAFFELLGWASFYAMMTTASERHITIIGICQSVIILFFFFGDGVGKAATAIAGNLIGAGRPGMISKIIVSGVKLHVIFFTLIILGLSVSTDFVIKQFLPHASPETLNQMHGSLIFSLYGILVHLFLEWIRTLFAGILTAAGDTLFLLVSGGILMWTTLVLPIYFFVVRSHGSVESGVVICCLFSIGIVATTFWRYTSGRWKSISIRDEAILS